jgi:hypothetical protein
MLMNQSNTIKLPEKIIDLHIRIYHSEKISRFFPGGKMKWIRFLVFALNTVFLAPASSDGKAKQAL